MDRYDFEGVPVEKRGTFPAMRNEVSEETLALALDNREMAIQSTLDRLSASTAGRWMAQPEIRMHGEPPECRDYTWIQRSWDGSPLIVVTVLYQDDGVLLSAVDRTGDVSVVSEFTFNTLDFIAPDVFPPCVTSQEKGN